MDNENKEFNQDFAEQAPRAEALKEAEEARIRAAEERGEGAEAAAEMEAEESVMRDVRIVSPTALVLKRSTRGGIPPRNPPARSPLPSPSRVFRRGIRPDEALF